MGNHHRTSPRAQDVHPGDPPCDRWQRRLKLARTIAAWLIDGTLTVRAVWKDPAIPGRMWVVTADSFTNLFRQLTA